MCAAEYDWYVIRYGDLTVTWACAEHLSRILRDLIHPGHDGRTVFKVIHHSEVPTS